MPPIHPVPDHSLVARLLATPESRWFEAKRAGANQRKLETLLAFANTEGGMLVIGLDDPDRATGSDRVYGVEENPEAVDELRRLVRQRFTPPLAPPDCIEPVFFRVGCTLRDGRPGSLMLVRVTKSAVVHSVVDGGTYVRLDKSNRQISARDITELALSRGKVSVLTAPVDVPFELLDTATWQQYATQRRLSRPIAEALRHLGLARNAPDSGRLQPTRAAVLLFAESPGGLLDTKCAIRISHYRGEQIERSTNTNLVRPPRTVEGPLLTQIRDATKYTIEELASAVQVGPLGFEIAQKYPVRVVQEAITNAVIHRDYRLSSDIQIRIFANRIEVESPGVLPGRVTVANLREVGSQPRNQSIVDHLREFPMPPNLDAGEGVQMMFATMARAALYPPVFKVPPELSREAVQVVLSNEARPSVWLQVEDYLSRNEIIGNLEVRQLLGTDNTVRASKLLKSWVDAGLLTVDDPDAAKKNRRYRKPESRLVISLPEGKHVEDESEEA